MSLSKRQEERHLRAIRELLKLPENKKCFDCPAKSPVYVNLMNNTFICAQCSGLHREFSHRVKSLSASTFTSSEVSALKEGGNLKAKRIWLAKLTPQDIVPDLTTAEGVRKFMRQKYVEKRYLDKEAFSALKKNQSLESLTGSDGKSTYSSPSTSAISLGHIGVPGGLSSPSMSSRVRRGSIRSDHPGSATSPKLGATPYSPKVLGEDPFPRNINPALSSPKQDDFSRAFGDLSISPEGLKSNAIQSARQPLQANGSSPSFNDIFSDSLHPVTLSPPPVPEASTNSMFDQAFLLSDQGRTNSLPNSVSPARNSSFDEIFSGYASPQLGQPTQFNNAPHAAAFELKRAETAPAQIGQSFPRGPLANLHSTRALNEPNRDYNSVGRHDFQGADPHSSTDPNDHFDALFNHRPVSQPAPQPLTQPHTDSFDSLFGLTSSAPTSSAPQSTASTSTNLGPTASFEQKYPSIDFDGINNPTSAASKADSMVEKKGNRNSIPQFFHLSSHSSDNQAMDDFLFELTGNKSGQSGTIASSASYNCTPETDLMSQNSIFNESNPKSSLDRGHISGQQPSGQQPNFKPPTSSTFNQASPSLQSTSAYVPNSNGKVHQSPFQSPFFPTNSVKVNPFSSPHLGHTINRSASLPVSNEENKPVFTRPSNFNSPSLSSPPMSYTISPSLSTSTSHPPSPSLTTNPFANSSKGSNKPPNPPNLPNPPNRSPNAVNPFGQSQGKPHHEKSSVTSSSIFGNSRTNPQTNTHFGNPTFNQSTSSSFLDLDPLKNDVKFGASSLKNENKWYH